MRALRDSRGRLVVRHAPVVAPLTCFIGFAFLVAHAIRHVLIGEVAIQSVHAPIAVAFFFFCGGCAFGSWWTGVIDQAAGVFRWRDRGVLRTKTGEIPLDSVEAVIRQTLPGSGPQKRPYQGLALKLSDGSVFRISQASGATPGEILQLDAIAAAFREELGMPIPSEQQAVIDSVRGAPSVVAAVSLLHEEYGMSLAGARGVVRGLRGPGPSDEAEAQPAGMPAGRTAPRSEREAEQLV